MFRRSFGAAAPYFILPSNRVQPHPVRLVSTQVFSQQGVEQWGLAMKDGVRDAYDRPPPAGWCPGISAFSLPLIPDKLGRWTVQGC